MMNTLVWCAFLVFDLIAATFILYIYFERRGHLIHLRHGWYPIWHNVTPGYPDAIPRVFQLRFSPFPLPRGQNISFIAGVAIKPDRPVILRGKPNCVRFWNFVFYPRRGKKHDPDLPGIDSFAVEYEPDGSYTVTFSPIAAGKNWVNTGDFSCGILFMRNYIPIPGHPIRLPAIYYGERLVQPEQELDMVPASFQSGAG